MTTNGRRRQSCFLFYIYGFFLGLGTGVICAIVAFENKKPATVASKVLIVSACVLSLLTFIGQLVVGCRSQNSAGQRSATIAIGLIITAVLTIAGVACSPGMQGVFFMSGAFSVVLYLFTVAAFSISFFRNRKTTRQARESGSPPPTPWSISHRLARSIPLPDLPSLGVLNEQYDGSDDSQGGRRMLSINELLLLGIPPNVALPEYSEVPAATDETRPDPPPSYFETESRPAEPHEDDDLPAPPSYTEISSVPFPLLVPIQTAYADNNSSINPGENVPRTNES